MSDDLLEQHLFISQSKVRDTLDCFFDKIFQYPVDQIQIEYSDKPDELYSTINNRTKKMLVNIKKPEKVVCISGRLTEGGSFKLINGNLHIEVTEQEYNYELISSLKDFLSCVFPIWLLRNPYIWGASIFEHFDKQVFYELSRYSVRSKLLEHPEVDIYRRDDGIIQKYRFFVDEDLASEEGLKYLAPFFQLLRDGLKKGNYEGIELFNQYCKDHSIFRKTEPRTKLGKKIKSMLHVRA